jgi:ABC-type sugar transport system substrate-binding protein
MSKKIVLCFENEANEHQQLVKDDAIAAARRAGFEIDIHFAGGSPVKQISQMYRYLHGTNPQRPVAFILMPVRDNSLDRVARDAVRAGVGWICLHRRMDCLKDLRKESPNTLICTVKPDQHEVGRIQSRQFLALLPEGGNILYVQGSAANSSARERLEGMRDSIVNTNLQIAGVLDGNWTTADAERVVNGWMRMVLSGKSTIDLIGCQNDLMGIGARNAAKAVSEYLRLPDLARVPITGCDGLPSFGQKLVREGVLSATVVIPSTGALAVDLITGFLKTGHLPQAEYLVHPVSYPEEKVIKTEPESVRPRT